MTTIYVNDKEKLPKRRDNDLYPTEPDLIRAALDEIDLTETRTILDIGAGDGRWGRTAKEICGGASIYGCDIVGDMPKDFVGWSSGDYLQIENPKQFFDLIVSNPPYYMAEDIIRKAWTELAPYGWMVMLLRLSFQSGVDRYHKLWLDVPLKMVGVVSRRPSFYDRGTNGTDYGVYYWHKLGNGRPDYKRREWTTFLLLHERELLVKAS